MSIEIQKNKDPFDSEPESLHTCVFLALEEAQVALHALYCMEDSVGGSKAFSATTKDVFLSALELRKHPDVPRITYLTDRDVLGGALVVVDKSSECDARERRYVRRILCRNFRDYIDFLPE